MADMFDRSLWDSLIVKAQQFEKIMTDIETRTRFSVFDAMFNDFKKTNKEADVLSKLMGQIKKDFENIALSQASMTRAELDQITKLKNRQDLLNKIYNSLLTQTKEIDRQKSLLIEEGRLSKQREQSKLFDLRLEERRYKAAIKSLEANMTGLRQQVIQAKTLDDKLQAEVNIYPKIEAIKQRISILDQSHSKISDKILEGLQQEQQARQDIGDKIREAIKEQENLRQLMLAPDEVTKMAERLERTETAERRRQELLGSTRNLLSPLLDAPFIKQFAQMIEGIIGASLLATLSLGVGAAVGYLFRQAYSAAQGVAQTGFNIKQMELFSGGDVNAALAHGHTMLSAEERTRMRGTAANTLGGLGAVSSELVGTMGQLNKQYGISDDVSARLLSTVLRWNHFQSGITTSTATTVLGFAAINKMAPAELFKEMADHTEVFARFANQGTQSFLKSLATVKQYGQTLEGMEGLANHLVDDFENSLQIQAKVQTVLPGLDLSRVLYASQFGNTGDVTRELSAAFQASGLQNMSQLPRSIQNIISNSLGIPIDQLNNAISGQAQGTTAVMSSQDKLTEATNHLSTVMQQVASSGLLSTLAAIPTSMANAIGLPKHPLISMGLGTALGGATGAGLGALLGFLSPMPGGALTGAKLGGTLGSIVGGGLTGLMSNFETHHTGGIVGVPKYHSGLLPNEMHAILQKGEAVMTPQQMNSVAQAIMFRSPAASTVQTTDTSGVEKLLKDILMAVKEGGDVNLDSKKVGEVMMASYIRGG